MQNFVIWDATPKKKPIGSLTRRPSSGSRLFTLSIRVPYTLAQTRIVRLITIRHAGPRRIIGLDTAGWSRRGVMLGCRGRTAKYLRTKDRFNKVFYFFVFRFIFFHNFIGQSHDVYAHSNIIFYALQALSLHPRRLFFLFHL